MSDSGALDQSEIEQLLSGMGGGAPVPPAAPPLSTGSAPNPDSAGSDAILSQDELNALFGGAASPPPVNSPLVPPPPPASVSPPPAAAPAFASGWNTVAAPFQPAANEEDEDGIPRGDLDYLAKKADETLGSIAATPMSLPTEVIEFQFPEFGGTVPSSEHTTLDQISEVDLDVKVELGRTYMYIEDVLKLRRGSVVPLDKMAGETVDIYINGRLLARGEVLIMNENFCVRIAELLAGAIPME
jgi:flagellar motor switch protein FliN/FliY